MTKPNKLLTVAVHVAIVSSLLATVACNNAGVNNALPETDAIPFLETEGGRYGFISTSSGEILCSNEIKVDALGGTISSSVNGVFKVPVSGGYEYYTNPAKPEKIGNSHYLRGGCYTAGCIPVVADKASPFRSST